MRKLTLLLLFLSCLYGTAIGQYYPPYAISAQNPSGQLVFVSADSSGNLYTNGLGSSGAPTAVSGYVPPVAMTGQSPSGTQVYLKTDANGNLYVNCQTGCSGGGGSGTVTNIVVSSPLTGGTITTTGTIGCASCVTSSAPGTGIAHFAGSTQAVTSSLIVIADLSATGVASSSTYLRGDNTWATVSGGGLSGLTTNVLIKAASATTATNSSITDNGTTVTTTDTGGFVGPSFTFNGTTAGFYDFPQGSTSSAVAPCNTANSICIQAPTSVTAYVLNLPAAQPAANNNFVSCTAANPTVCSFAQVLWSQLGNAAGALTLANGTNATTFNQTSAVAWTWANTTAASTNSQQNSPITTLCGQGFEGASPANTQSCFTLQLQFCTLYSCPSPNNNGTPTLVVQNTDSTTTNGHDIGVMLQGVDIFFDANKNNMNIGGALVAPAGTQIIAIGHGVLDAEASNGGGDTVVGYNSMSNANGDNQNTVMGASAGNSCTGCVGIVMLGYTVNAGAGSSYSEVLGDGTSIGSFTDDVIIGQGLTGVKDHQTIIGTAAVTDALINGVLHSGSSVELSAATTITSLTFVTTGLALPATPLSTTLRGSCSIIWEQSTGVNTVQFGAIMNTAPTDLYVMNTLHSGTSGSTLTDQYTTITGTSATAISATGVPGATATGYKEEIDFTMITGGTNKVTLTIEALTGSASDAVVIEPGSSCGWLP